MAVSVPSTVTSCAMNHRGSSASAAVDSPDSNVTLCMSTSLARNSWSWVSNTAAVSAAAVLSVRVSVKVTSSSSAVNAVWSAAMVTRGACWVPSTL